MLTARDIMNGDVITADPDWSVSKVLDLLLFEDVGSIPIVDNNGRMVGLVTESVLLVAAFDLQLRSDSVSLHMQRRFLSAGPDEPVDQLAQRFLLHRVRHFPVMENGRLLGLITRRQLMKAALGRESSRVMADPSKP